MRAPAYDFEDSAPVAPQTKPTAFPVAGSVLLTGHFVPFVFVSHADTDHDVGAAHALLDYMSANTVTVGLRMRALGVATIPSANDTPLEWVEANISRTAFARQVVLDHLQDSSPQILAPRPEVLIVLRIAERWALSDHELGMILGGTNGALPKKLRAGITGFDSRDRQDRARLLMEVYEGVFTLFEAPEREQTFLKTPREKLDGKSLHDLMVEGSMLNLIKARDFLHFFNGRL